MTDFEHLRLERPAEGIARIVLDNPDQRNAMSPAMTTSWVRAIDQLAHDPDVRVVVVTGAGSAFSSGGDTAWLAGDGTRTVDELRTQMLGFYRSWLSIRRLEVPTIAAINGHAVGAGLCLALACDLRFAADGARMSVPFTRLGLHPGMAGTFLLPDVVGPAVARDLFLTGRAVTGQEALTLGLVSRVIAPDSFADDVLAAASSIAEAAPIATRLTKTALARGHADLDACLAWEGLAQPVTLATADLQEGIAAVQEKRRPRFTGR
ncbi:enoyl-CoA hydratase/isomerase family protein [Nocardioides sp. R-C-SC26]|uniref:enoyl-CoA hydratase/isomerase family protein n=1 Tax=Nocardioides sp. R-C-SC26 TaxID=2870414 RepID=UPI001E507712|nr:enoyl-CoA hydratase-related protein [Nocardioides sp. R-C-SC26]